MRRGACDTPSLTSPLGSEGVKILPSTVAHRTSAFSLSMRPAANAVGEVERTSGESGCREDEPCSRSARGSGRRSTNDNAT